MSSLSIGLSALTVNQRLLDMTGHNVANANTPGYHRQIADLAARTAGLSIGAGVEIQQIRRAISEVLERALTQNASTTESLSTQLGFLRQVESLLSLGEGGLSKLLQDFLDKAEQLSTRPDDLTQRQVFIASAASLTDGLSGFSKDLTRVQTGVDTTLREAIDSANATLVQIAALNKQIQSATLRGTNPNDLKDQRDQLITKLASIINVQVIPEDFGQKGVIAGGMPAVLGSQAYRLEAHDNGTAGIVLRVVGSSADMKITGGQLGGLLNLHNDVLPDVRQRIDALAHELIRGVNQIHATSIPLDGPFVSLAGERAVTSSTVPLSQSGLDFIPQAGNLFLSVTNLATGARTLTAVAIDPAVQSLQDVATALSAVPNIQAVVDAQTQTLRILAGPGYAADFAGRLPTLPQTAAISGTATVQLAGHYNGAANDRYDFRVVGNGTVGLTPNLALEVRDSVGTLLGTFNIGQGYEPGTILQTVQGVSVQFTTGTLNNGDTFSTATVADADSGGVLNALGVNGFFQGDNSGSIRVRADLLDHPERLALSSSGRPGNGGALERLAALRDSPVLANGQQSLSQFLTALLADTGLRVQDLSQRHEAQEVVGQRLTAEQQSLSGVDQNEELLRLTQFQHAFQMGARYLTVIGQLFDDLLQVV